MTAMSFADRLRARVEAGATSYASIGAREERRKSRNVVRTNMFDERQYKKARETSTIDALVDDLMLGDEHKGGQRGAFDPAGELVKAVYHTFYKAAPTLEDKRNLERDCYPARQIVAEIMENPKLADLQQFTVSDPLMATMAVDAISDDLREILGRLPEPPQPPGDPNAPQGQQGQQGGGGGQGKPGGGQGKNDKFVQPPKQPDPNAQGQGGGQGGQGGQQQPQQGQGQGGQGQPGQQGQPQQGQGGGQGQGQPGGGQGQQPQGGGSGGGNPGQGGQAQQPGGNQQGQGQGGQGQGKQDPNQQPGQGGQGGQGQPDPSQQGQPAGGNGLPDEGAGSEGQGSGGGGADEDLINEEQTGDDFDAEAEKAMEQAEADWESEYDNRLKDLELDRRINHALEKAEEQAQELDDIRRGIGLEDGEWKSMDPEERLIMAERLRTPEMKELSKVVGRMKKFASAVKATKINDVPHEAYDVETGNALRRVLKPQYVFLTNPATKVEFYRRYTDKELLQFKMRGKEEVGKGPIVLCVDKSGSMQGAPANWALGIAEALRRFASEDDRDLEVMFFGNNNDRVRFSFPKGKAPFEKILTFLGTVSNGGTQFDGVLTEALEKATKAFDGEGKGKADVVFITDGQASLDASWIKDFNAEKERTGVRVYSIYVGGARDMAGQKGPTQLLGAFSDAVIPVAELQPESARLIFERV